MANVFITPYMGLPLAIPGQDPGPDYANNQYTEGIILDQHNHSPGSGQQINPSGLNINADLPIKGNNLTLVRTVNFNSQSGPLSGVAPDIGCIYVAGNELYYNDETGNMIQITNNGSVNAGAGSISGLPSGTASVFFTGSSYVFQQATNVAANIDGASFIFRNTTVSSNGITLSPPNSLAANYNETLPIPPSTKGIMTMDPSGNMNVEPAAPAAASVVTVDTSGNLGTQPLAYNVTVGVGGTYSTITAMLAAVSNDTSVLILVGTYTENPVISKRLKIEGQGYGTVINGNLEFASGCDDGTFKQVRITGTVTVDSAVNEIGITDVWVTSRNNVIINSNSSGVVFKGWEL